MQSMAYLSFDGKNGVENIKFSAIFQNNSPFQSIFRKSKT